MSFGAWIVAGLVVGFIASKLIIRSGYGLMRDLGLGVAGAVFAGLIFGAVAAPDASGTEVFGLVVPETPGGTRRGRRPRAARGAGAPVQARRVRSAGA